MTQSTFTFDPPAIRTSPTSVAAAVALAPTVASLRQRVLNHIRSCGPDGCTDEALADAMQFGKEATSRARRIELTHMGLVKSSGLTRPTRSGRLATLWTTT